MAHLELVQINPANVLMVEVRVLDWDQFAADDIEYRQTIPGPQRPLMRVPVAATGTIITFEGQITDAFRLVGIFYARGTENITGATSPQLDYNPTARARASASGLARSDGSIHFAGDLHRAGAAGLARSDGAAALDPRTVNHRVRASGSGTSDGEANLSQRTVIHRVSAAGTATSGGEAAAGIRRPEPISASGLARSDGRAHVVQGSSSSVSANGHGTSGGRARLRVRAPAARSGRLTRAFPQQATIERRGPSGRRDEYGDVVLEVIATDEVACNLQPQWSRETTANQDVQSESWNLYLPAGVALGGQDRVTIDGMVLEVFGPGGEFFDFDARPHHVEATLRRVT